jgi:hypothetical protein
MAIVRQTARKSVHPYRWRPPPPEVVDPEPSDSSSDFEDKMPRIIEFSSESESEVFLEFEPEPEKEVLDELGEIDFEDPEADRPRKKLKIDGYDSDTSDASGDYEIVDPIKDIEDKEENFYVGEDPYVTSSESEGDSDLD